MSLRGRLINHWCFRRILLISRNYLGLRLTIRVKRCHLCPTIAGHGADTMPRITETFTKRAETPKTGNKIHYDDAIKGFGLRTTRGGTKAFILNFTINRRERRMTIGSYPAWTAAAAREEAKRLRRLIDQGQDPLEERNRRQQAPNVASLWSEYQRVHLPTLSSRSQGDQRSMWNKFILPELQFVQVRKLTSSHIERWSWIFDQFAAGLSYRIGFISGGGFQVRGPTIICLARRQQPMR